MKQSAVAHSIVLYDIIQGRSPSAAYPVLVVVWRVRVATLPRGIVVADGNGVFVEQRLLVDVHPDQLPYYCRRSHWNVFHREFAVFPGGDAVGAGDALLTRSVLTVAAAHVSTLRSSSTHVRRSVFTSCVRQTNGTGSIRTYHGFNPEPRKHLGRAFIRSTLASLNMAARVFVLRRASIAVRRGGSENYVLSIPSSLVKQQVARQVRTFAVIT